MPNDYFEIQSLDDKLREIARNVDKELPNNTGFAILIFPFNIKNGDVSYISNADRNDVANAMKEWISKVDEDNYGKDI